MGRAARSVRLLGSKRLRLNGSAERVPPGLRVHLTRSADRRLEGMHPFRLEHAVNPPGEVATSGVLQDDVTGRLENVLP